MRKYYYYEPTIEKTLRTDKKSLEKMIRRCVGNRKSVDEVDGLGVPKRKKFRRAFPKKKILSPME